MQAAVFDNTTDIHVRCSRVAISPGGAASDILGQVTRCESSRVPVSGCDLLVVSPDLGPAITGSSTLGGHRRFPR